APLESTGEEAVVNDEAAAAVVKEVSHEFTEEDTAAAVIKVTQEEHFVENVAFGSVAVEGFLLESTSETNTDSSAADERGNSIDQMATTNRSLRARKNGKVLPKSDGEVIDLEAIPSSTFNESHRHLFIFPASMSGETKLNSIITSEFVDTASVWNRKICMFTNSSRNKCELLYSDFTRYKNKSFTTCNVMNGFFNLLSEHFVDKDAAFGTTFDGAVYKSGLKLPVKKLREVLKHRRVESVYLPLNVNDNHWILVVINWPGYRVDVYDSLDSKNEIVCGTFISLLRKCQKESDVNKWQAHNHYQENIQRQFDSYSCGYFTCWYAYQLVNNGTIGLFTDSYEVSVANIASKILISLIEASIVL
ncbi:MAG: Ulp1 family isopeptidase, partial [Fimbriimonas sp.]